MDNQNLKNIKINNGELFNLILNFLLDKVQVDVK